MPVPLLRGQQTRRSVSCTDVERHIAEHVADPHVRELPDVGHFAPSLAPEPVAEAPVSFLGSAQHQA